MAVFENEKILFKQGTQEKLNSLNTSVVGAFYLTNDTHRLYIGEDAAKGPVPVNQGVLTVATINDLPATGDAGQFYLVSDGNILCIYSQNKWVQINTDTTLDDTKKIVSVVGDASSKSAVVDLVVTDTAGKQEIGDFTVEGGAGVNIAVSGNTITISASGTGGVALDLGAEAVDGNKSAYIKTTTTVTDSAGNVGTPIEDKIGLVAGSNIDTIVAEGDGITINAATQEVKSHVFNNEAQGFTFVTDQTSGNAVTSSVLDPIIKIGKANAEVHFVEGIADLDVYTITEADTKIENEIAKKLRTADAMTFKGVINTAADLPEITSASNGDTYKVSTPGTYAGIVTKEGDLLIASGTEDAETGKITTGSWVYVPSANEYETAVTNQTHGIRIHDASEAKTFLGAISLKEGAKVVLTDSEDAEHGKVVEVAHATTTVTTNTDNPTASTAYAGTSNSKSKTITVIKSVTHDDYGHVTNIETAQEEIKDSVIDSVAVDYSVAGDVATIGTTLTDGLNNNVAYDVKVTSETLSMSGSANDGLTVELKWGSF